MQNTLKGSSNMDKNLIDRLKAGRNNIKAIPFPGIPGTKVGLRILSDQETKDAYAAAENYFTRIKLDIKDSTLDMYIDERANQILFRVLCDPEDSSVPAAPSADALRRLLTKAEKDALAREYAEFEEECSPNYAEKTEEELSILWEDVKKNPITLLSDLSTGTLRRLLRYLVFLPAISRTDSGST